MLPLTLFQQYNFHQSEWRLVKTCHLFQDELHSKVRDLKESYYDNLTECFFLQNGGQFMDYYPWRKKPTLQLVHFLKSGLLDSDNEDENPVIYLKEGKSDDVRISVFVRIIMVNWFRTFNFN